MAKRFKDLDELEILALAISSEEEDGRTYGDFAEALRNDYPGTGEIFRGMQAEEAEHRRQDYRGPLSCFGIDRNHEGPCARTVVIKRGSCLQS